MDGRKLLAFAVLLILVSGCTLPEDSAGEEIQGGEKEDKPPIRQVDKTVAIVDDSVQEPAVPEEEPAEEVAVNEAEAGEGNETVSGEMPAGNETAPGEEALPEEAPSGEEPEETEPEPEPEEEPGEEGNGTGIRLVEFQPAALLLDCNGDCTRHRVYDEENDVVIAAINQSRLLMARETEHFLLYSHGCEESGGLKDSFAIGGEEYWFNYPAAFKRDWADFAEFQGNVSGFSLHEGESRTFNGERVFLWRIVPGASVCNAYLEISILGDTVFLEEWMDGVVLGLEEEGGELRLEYLMYPEDALK